MNFNWKDKTVLITGGEGFLGKYVVSEIKKLTPKKILVASHSKYDLTKRADCERAVKGVDVVIHLAAQIGGIGFIDELPGEIFYNNAIMGIELMEASRKSGVKKFVTIGTVCEYPENSPRPFKEENLWDGYPEETTAPYGWAKKIQIVQSMAYRKQYGFNSIHLLPVNLYGPGDNFDKKQSHVIPALIKRFVNAKENNQKEVVVWGTGKATREFLYVEDAARAIVDSIEKYNLSEPLNLGTGEETSIREVVNLLTEIVGYKGKVVWDSSKPDGQPRRQLDVSRMKSLTGFKARVGFKDGLERTVKWYQKFQ